MKAILNRLIVETVVEIVAIVDTNGDFQFKREVDDEERYYRATVVSKGKEVTDEIQVGDVIRIDFGLIAARAFKKEVIGDKPESGKATKAKFYLNIEEREIAYKD